MYETNIVLSLNNPDGDDQEWKKTCQFPDFFHAVPGVNFDFCDIDGDPWSAEITQVYGRPTHLPNKLMDIEAKVDHIKTTEDFKKILSEIKKQGWKRTGP